jgi:hypothetical protein
MRNTVAKKRAGQQDANSDYLFANFLQKNLQLRILENQSMSPNQDSTNG